MKVITPRWSLPLLIVSFFTLVPFAAAHAQAPTIPYKSLLLLVAGPSGDKIDPRERAVVDHLNTIRRSYNFPQLQLGTMHYNRRDEAALLKNTLGFSPAKGITVGLVQLSDQGLPVRTLYKLEGVTQASLMAAQNDLLSRWSQTTRQPLPRELRPPSAGGPASPGGVPVASTTSPAQPWMIPNITPTQVYTFEGIQAVIKAIDDYSGGMWKNLMNAPLRSDGNDLAVREQTKALAEATLALRQASEAGVIFPMEQLAAVSRAGKAWQAAEPQYYLPVPLRGSVQAMTGLLHQVDEIQVQGSKTPATSP